MKSFVPHFDLYWTGIIQRQSPALAPLMKALTIFGQPVAMGIVLGLGAVASLFSKDSRGIALFSVGLLVLPLASLIKLTFRRVRPLTYKRTRLPSYSFPSGHAYGTTMALSLVATQTDNFAVASAAFVLSFLVGISRIYRGAHFPSDVLGGWIIAFLVTITMVTGVDTFF